MATRRRAMGGVLALVLWMLATPVQARAEFDLMGAWYVLIHYRDSATYNPDVDRWLDKIWTFKQKGSRVEWTEYPIVVFVDQAGRFERYRGVRSRVLAAWEPNATQMAQIKGGLEINNRGSKSKSLRGSPARGYKSTSRMRTQSASVIGYVENWSVEDVEGKPIFTFDDVMGSGRTENMEGRTRYTTTAVGDGGDLLEGAYNRDGTRIGTFQLIRAGQVARVAGKSKKVQEEREQLFIEGIQRSGIGVGVGRDGKDVAPQEDLAAIEGLRRAGTEVGVAGVQVDPQEVAAQGNLADILTAAGGEIDLEKALQAIHAPPLQVNASVSLRQVEIVRLGDAGVERIDYEDVKAGRVTPSDEESYGIVTERFCSQASQKSFLVNWYLLPRNSLRAWDHTQFMEGCGQFLAYEPARGKEIELERQLVGYQEEKFHGAPAMKMHLYQKGLALVAAERIEDAEAILVRAENSVDSARQGLAGSRHGRWRTRVASQSDYEALKERFTQAIATAKRTRVSSPQDLPAE